MRSLPRTEYVKAASRGFLGCIYLSFTACLSLQAQPVVTKSWGSLADARKMVFSQNVLWIAGGGVTKYDIASRTKKRYTVQEGLASNATFDVAFDSSSHTLWIATSSGLAEWDITSGRERFLYGQPESPGPFVLSLCNGSGVRPGRLWIGTRGKGLYALDKGSSRIAQVLSAASLPDSWVSSLAIDPARLVLWAGTPAGIVRVSLNSDTPRIDSSLANNAISARRLTVDGETGDIYCVTYLNELFRYCSTANSWDQILLPIDRTVERVSDLQLSRIEKSLWIASSAGVLEFDLKTQRWQEHDFAKREVSSLALDAAGDSVFFATRDGVFCSELRGMEAHRVLQNSPPFNNTVNAIHIEKRRGRIWFGTDGGIAGFDKRTQRWEALHPFQNSRERILALAVCDSSVWIGTMSHGFAKLDVQTGQVEEIQGTAEGSTVTSMLIDQESRKIWFGVLGPRGGVYEYEITSKKLRVLPFLSHVSVTSLLMDGRTIWAGTNLGVAKFQKDKELKANPFEEDLQVSDVLALAFDRRRGQLWVTTEYAVVRYNVFQKRAVKIGNVEGFPTSVVTTVLCDGARIWLGTEGDGLYMYDPALPHRPLGGNTRGLGDRYVISMAYDEEDETLWVGTVNGGISVLKVHQP
jgi:ligand-binding sensor domain-containing protein